ncbi:ADP-ribosylation factor-like protein 2-binding protein isoform X1 [Xiphophorus maculatus]|uniref:ADP-ribosylation factor-like protein 2-binding protein isoform X1 n=1 Tax=Xiphophorus maculatus TaxID=8083 RepID=UPI000C6EFECE|nr:ADP-ribosylation factor-like protein 2-binding protein isoform X1 [Xiphophorus maculatus]
MNGSSLAAVRAPDTRGQNVTQHRLSSAQEPNDPGILFCRKVFRDPHNTAVSLTTRFLCRSPNGSHKQICSGTETGPVRMEEELFAPSCSSAAEAAFDVVIGCILEIIMEEDFQLVQRSFLDRHYLEFEESDENKLSYTLIFNEYVELLEKPLEECLMKKIPGFNMASFIQLLMQHKEEVPDEMFDMLLTFIDFMAFKDMFVEYRAVSRGRRPEQIRTPQTLTSGCAPCVFRLKRVEVWTRVRICW